MSMFREMRSACPNSNNVCSSVNLRKIRGGDNTIRDEFDLHLKWVPDEQSRTFLKTFAFRNNLSLIETEKTVTLTAATMSGSKHL
jgi:hypothetical protein